jgi:Putative Ig domain
MSHKWQVRIAVVGVVLLLIGVGLTSLACSKSTSRSLAITTLSFPSGSIGANYSETLAASGGSGNYTWSISSGSLPAGLTLNPSTGVISGMPSAAGTSGFTVQVSDGVNTATSSLSITINSTTSDITVTSSISQGHTHQVTISGADIDNPPSANKTINTTTSSYHYHTITLTPQDYQTLKDGGEVTVTTSLVNGHTHTFAIKKG